MQIMNQDLSEVQDRLPEGLISPTYERHEAERLLTTLCPVAVGQ
jgi:hypothetical protein